MDAAYSNAKYFSIIFSMLFLYFIVGNVKAKAFCVAVMLFFIDLFKLIAFSLAIGVVVFLIVKIIFWAVCAYALAKKLYYIPSHPKRKP